MSLNGPARLSLYPRLTAGISRLFLGVLARVRVEGMGPVPTKGPLIIAANHLSMADPPLIGGWLAPKRGRRPVFLAKASRFVWPLRSFLRSLGARPVKAGGSDFGAYRLAKGVLDEGGVIVILPEGTRSLDGDIHHAGGRIGSRRNDFSPIRRITRLHGLAALRPRPRAVHEVQCLDRSHGSRS